MKGQCNTCEHTAIPTGKLNPLDQQQLQHEACVCFCVCLCEYVCAIGVQGRKGKGRWCVLMKGEEMEAVLQSKQNEQYYLCVSIYVEFPR